MPFWISQHKAYVALLLAGLSILFLFPIAYPLEIKQKDDAQRKMFDLYGDQTFGQTFRVFSTNLSEVTFFTAPSEKLPLTASIELTVRSSAESNDDIRHVVTTLYQIKQEDDRITIRFQPIQTAPGTDYYAFVRAPQLSSANSLPLRYHPEDSYADGTLVINHQAQPGDAVINLATRKGMVQALVTRIFDYETEREDIHLLWEEGGKIIAGQNPYARILEDKNLRINKQYPTYLPLFYLFSVSSQKLGLADYDDWITFWRIVFLLFHLAVGGLLFTLLYRWGHKTLAIFALLFWLGNRWTLYVSLVGLFDFIPIFFLVLSVALFPRRRWLAGISLGISIAIRQMALPLIPLYLIWAWQHPRKGSRTRSVLTTAVAVGIVPLITSLPFIWWNAPGFWYSIMFSLTRLPTLHIDVPSLDATLGLVGIPAKFLLITLMALVYAAAFQRKIGRYGAVLLIFMTFLDFHSVFFKQYVAWVIPFIPLAVGEYLTTVAPKKSSIKPQQTPAVP